MPATKTAKKSARKSSKPAAKKESAKRTKEVEQHVSRNQQGRIIQETMTKSPLTIQQLAERTGFSVARVQEHVDYEVSKQRSKMNGKKQVIVLSQPVRRAG